MHAWRVIHGAASDVGLARHHNEDRFHADPSTGLFIVCDGMGGHRAGEVASTSAIEVIPRHLAEAASDPSIPMIGISRPEFSRATNRLAGAVRLANHRIHQEAARHADYQGMGTTVVAAWLVGNVLSIAHVGDSRLYLIRGNVVRPLTADHSLVYEQLRGGLLTADEAERASHKHVLTRALGAQATVEVELGELPVLCGDILLLCSDGLTAGVRPYDILRAVHESSDAQTVSNRLIDLSNAAGGADNVTVIVATVTKSTTGMWDRIRAKLFATPSTGSY
jgi:protein phosphatase